MQPLTFIYDTATHIFDPLHYFWERDETQRSVAGILVIVFFLALGTIEMKRQGWITGPVADMIPTSHYMAINLAFTLVLILEVISLIFTLPCSISKAVGKQFEILALILLRSSFKTLAGFPEPITITGHEQELWIILSDGGGAIAIFGLLGVYTLLRQHLEDTVTKGQILFKFVAAKKIVALSMLTIFIGMAIKNGLLFLHGEQPFHFFQSFYTVLIFSDIMLVLIAQRFLPEFHAIFRNSGFALATLLIRLALTAPPFYNVLIGIGSASFACVLTLVYNTFYSSGSKYRGKMVGK
ncbi:hypothetical protein [Pseudodesulfovibrio piezophilus]|uniref:Uncharacterized protein n=1 Tax=Pseudodesulfovibrio piezophilus (strain DSM 21447 / JCM 15486 / C1TLV30) TaxID=1322246 RepID=M1WL99_PSEP2|nr:hypothetical protein [Pseudodesulfovibrio piezophilus]CCH47495.1 conserved membrane protein of unknown function [Pseudodesulfovibrio piezophilus C1TLV30]